MSTSYTPYYSGGWQSGEEGNTPITPDALNHMDEGIGDAFDYVGESQLSNTIDLSMFTNINSHVDTSRFFRIRVGNVVYLSICLTGGITNNAKVFDINSAIVPRQQNTPCMIFNSNGTLVTNASVWLEASNTGKLTFYGTTLPSPGTYFLSLTYVI